MVTINGVSVMVLGLRVCNNSEESTQGLDVVAAKQALFFFTCPHNSRF